MEINKPFSSHQQTDTVVDTSVTMAPPSSHPTQARDKAHLNYNKRFSGKWALSMRGWIRHPSRKEVANQDPESGESSSTTSVGDEAGPGAVVKRADGKYAYVNEFHQESYKFDDVAVYLSPTRSAPRRLVVQATKHVLKNPQHRDAGDWIRTRVSGNVPLVLFLAEWALAPLERKGIQHKLHCFARMLLTAIPIQMMMAIPGLGAWDDDEVTESYTDFHGYHWDWPEYAVNALDMRPGTNSAGKAAIGALDYRRRSQRPRKLIVRADDGVWATRDYRDDDGECPSYVFISYVWSQFPGDDGKARIRRIAAQIAEAEGCAAYWLDQECAVQHAGSETDYDVYTMADTIRGSSKVAIVLADDSPKSRQDWGCRMWTLPEGLLAPGEGLLVCYEDAQGALQRQLRRKIELTGRLWGQSRGGAHAAPGEDETRLLAEHFSGLLTLSRLELLPAAIAALGARKTSDYTGADLAFAAMGLLHYRIEKPDRKKGSGDGQRDDALLFKSLAKLSLQNDNDQILERMLCLLPASEAKSLRPKPLFETLSTLDQFGTLVHHILPLCEIVGIAAEDHTVMVDGCRAMHIRWKDFPRPVTQRNRGLKKVFAAFFVGAGLAWLAYGLQLAIAYIPFWAGMVGQVNLALVAWVVVGFLIVGLLLSAFSPFSVRRLFSGTVLKSSPELVGFEGVMPIADLEKLVFGNRNGRLSYAASGSPLARDHRDERERRGKEPDWIRDPDSIQDQLPSPLHRLFTLVDMGERTVTIFSAERPPTAALLCGREGGMLRAVLCSWRFENDCLYKEAVVRVPSTVFEAATAKGWLKLCLMTQNQAQPRRATLPS